MSGAKMSGLEPTGASAVLPARPEPIQLESGKTALAVVDMQNGYASPSTYVEAGGSDPVISKKPEAPGAVPCSTRHHGERAGPGFPLLHAARAHCRPRYGA